MSKLENLFAEEDVQRILSGFDEIDASHLEDGWERRDFRFGVFHDFEVEWLRESNPNFAGVLDLINSQPESELLLLDRLPLPFLAEPNRALDHPEPVAQVNTKGRFSKFDIGYYTDGILIALRAAREADAHLISHLLASATAGDGAAFSAEPSFANDFTAGMMAYFKSKFRSGTGVYEVFEARGRNPRTPEAQLGFAYIMATLATVEERLEYAPTTYSPRT